MMKKEIKAELTVEAAACNLERITSFVDEMLDRVECPVKVKMKLDIAVDEILSNIIQYAYYPATGTVTVRLEILREPLTACVTFIDQGTPYNPLTAKEPDVSLSAEDRQVGGLGIYLVRKSMDEVSYEYEAGKNILTIKKRLCEEGSMRRNAVKNSEGEGDY